MQGGGTISKLLLECSRLFVTTGARSGGNFAAPRIIVPIIMIMIIRV